MRQSKQQRDKAMSSKSKSIVSALDFWMVKKSECAWGHIACVCNIKKRHNPNCKFLIAATGAIGIECKHGFDVCPKCDPCTCAVEIQRTK